MKRSMQQVWGILAVLLLTTTFASLGCGGNNTPTTGCYVNGTYYPNGNAPNDQCVCPPIGPCRINFPEEVEALLRRAHTVTLLSTGQLLFTGGRNSSGATLNTVELYDPAAQNFIPLTATMTTARSGHAATLIANGLVLLTGGQDSSGLTLNTAELYDPISQSFTALNATMTSARTGHKATLLRSGLVLLTGGRSSSGSLVNAAELYDPVAENFTALSAAMSDPQEKAYGVITSRKATE